MTNLLLVLSLMCSFSESQTSEMLAKFFTEFTVITLDLCKGLGLAHCQDFGGIEDKLKMNHGTDHAILILCKDC